MRTISLILCCLILAVGCTASARYEDVSDSENFRHVIGIKFATREDLLVLAITTDPNYAKRVDYFVVTAKPGFGGPEVVYKDVLPVKTVIQVKRAMKCVNCWLETRFYLEINVLNESFDRPIRVYLDGGTPVFSLRLDKLWTNPELLQAFSE